MKFIKAIPNTLTLCNLLCGIGAVYLSIEGNYTAGFYLVILGAVFDFLDGFAARMLKAYSPLGADLDSLADMISFGVAPAIMSQQLLEDLLMSLGYNPLFSYIALALAMFAALRLAKFNVDTRQSEGFIGLPTPAMSLMVFSWGASVSQTNDTILSFATSNPTVALTITLTLCLGLSALMVCEVPFFSFKFKSFGFAANKLRYIFAIFALICITSMGFASPFVIILSYILLSLTLAISCKGKRPAN